MRANNRPRLLHTHTLNNGTLQGKHYVLLLPLPLFNDGVGPSESCYFSFFLSTTTTSTLPSFFPYFCLVYHKNQAASSFLLPIRRPSLKSLSSLISESGTAVYRLQTHWTHWMRCRPHCAEISNGQTTRPDCVAPEQCRWMASRCALTLRSIALFLSFWLSCAALKCQSMRTMATAICCFLSLFLLLMLLSPSFILLLSYSLIVQLTMFAWLALPLMKCH